jgi:ABC-type enterochelin transport system permease subunit
VFGKMSEWDLPNMPNYVSSLMQTDDKMCFDVFVQNVICSRLYWWLKLLQRRDWVTILWVRIICWFFFMVDQIQKFFHCLIMTPIRLNVVYACKFCFKSLDQYVLVIFNWQWSLFQLFK